MHREDFAMLENDIVYFDNGATTLKPKCVVDKIVEYYTKYTSNIHRGDYDAAVKTNELYDDTRNVVSKFVNCSSDEVIFTSGTTMSINMVVFGFLMNVLNEGDEVLLTRSEHASNVLPWIKLSEDIGIKIRYMELDEDYSLSVDSVRKSITDKTKVISIAHVTNVIGDVRDIESIGNICLEKDIYFCVDGAQSVPHMKVDFKNSNIDFLSFSGHKMCGPTGVGCLISKKKYLDKFEPLCYGGGMNQYFESDNSYELKKGVTKFEAGTPNIAGVIGLREAILYLMDIGMDNIHKYEMELKKYLINGMSKLSNIEVYNSNSSSGIVAFNINGVFAQDSSIYLNHYNIYVRAGNHCTKMLKDDIGVKNTVRVSMYFYNTFQDVDRLLEVLKNSSDIFKIVL